MGKKVEFVKGKLEAAKFEGKITDIEIGGWLQILNYRSFLVSRKGAEDQSPEIDRVADLFITELSNLVVMGMHSRGVVKMGEWSAMGMTPESIEVALETYKLTSGVSDRNALNQIVITCPKCGSPDITVDSNARWNVDTQAWELSSTFDSKTCTTCSYEGNTFYETAVLDLTPAQVSFLTCEVADYQIPINLRCLKPD